jgi:hypothetical protein
MTVVVDCCSRLQIYLGGYVDEVEAAKAHDKAALAFWGDKTRLNVSVQPSHIIVYVNYFWPLFAIVIAVIIPTKPARTHWVIS